MKQYDLIVLGGGAGGLTVAAGAASMGAKVALIEKNAQPGGDCLHYGCVPSKALIHAAKKVHQARLSAEAFDLEVTGEADLLQALKRVKAAIAHIQKHDDADRFRDMGVDVYIGRGSFQDDHHLMIEGGETIYGKRIVISTGSRPVIPPIEGLKETGYITNETIFDLTYKPKRLFVIGAGVIGLELAQAMARFGIEVTVAEASSQLLGKEDEELVPFIQSALEKELKIMLNTKVQKVGKKENGDKMILVEQDGETKEILVDDILVATGRKPNTDRIGLDHTGVKTTDSGHIQVKPTLQTDRSHIYAIGDVLQAFPFTHAAGMEGKVVVSNAVFGLRRKVDYTHVPWVIYTDPEVFHLGLTEKEAREQIGSDIQVYKVTLDEVDRFIADHETEGLVKVITDKKGKIVGAHAVGKEAGDWMQEIVFAKHHGHKIGDISHVIHPYPTHGAAVQRASDQYWRNKLFSGAIPKLMKRYIRWFR
ncbi:dihydrolipoyl dehydrogenase family protein [Marinicrinis sediminis]|uniref:Dihydrolipoyl dehydrogenase family protein n=1 Tax=Marinicrinis sediminis TaxID=1652465 RepID=A0ABW5RDX1_9BACL